MKSNKKVSRTPKEQENKMINLAMNLAEKKLVDGTASSQLICHFLSLATMSEKLKNDKLKSEVELAHAKIRDLEQSIANSELYKEAIDAFKRYSGNVGDIEEDEED